MKTEESETFRKNISVTLTISKVMVCLIFGFIFSYIFFLIENNRIDDAVVFYSLVSLFFIITSVIVNGIGNLGYIVVDCAFWATKPFSHLAMTVDDVIEYGM